MMMKVNWYKALDTSKMNIFQRLWAKVNPSYARRIHSEQFVDRFKHGI